MSSTSPDISAGVGTDTNDAGLRLPYDIIAVIARVLAHGGRPIKPPRDLAALNRTSRAVYEITLPILYERMSIQSVEAFRRCVGKGNSPGWAYTKYLHLSHDAHLLLQQHQIFVQDSHHQPASDIDLLMAFPRLQLLCVAYPYEGEKTLFQHRVGPLIRKLAVDLFTSMTFDEMIYRAIPDDYHEPGMYELCICGTSLSPYGRWLFDDDDDDDYWYTSSIDSLTIHKGAGFRTAPYQRQLCLPDSVDVQVDIFTLDIRDDLSTDEVKLVIDIVTDFIGMNAASEFRGDHALRPTYVDLKCSLAVFATLSRVMRSKLSSFLRLNVRISGETTSVQDLQQQLALLAEYYHHIWMVDQEDDNEEFVSIKAHGEIAIPVDVQIRKGYPPQVQGKLWGMLAQSRIAGIEDHGFQADIMTSFFLEEREFVWGAFEQAYHPLQDRAIG